jgi:8-oxo-dGTP pyrophosphatase MutT (NUDIX family)
MTHPDLPPLRPAPRFDLRFVDEPWAFAKANRAGIDAHWAAETAKNPALFNGKVLLAVRSGLRADGTFFGDHISVDFDAFLTWRDWGFDAEDGRNIFGSALIRPTDGGLIMGRMAAHTSNAGRIYPPSGTLDLNDVAADGAIDIEAAMERELREETGLEAAALKRGPAFYIVEPIARICVARLFDSGMNAADTMAAIRANLARDPEPELDDVVHVRQGMDLPDSVFLPYVKTLITELA